MAEHFYNLSVFTAIDGENLAVYDWPMDRHRPRRGMVLIVHGLGEHAGRYEALAQQLNDCGFSVRGYDQYGHGESGGRPGTLPDPQRLLTDLADMVDAARLGMPAGEPLILLGHSMGGLVAARFASLNPTALQGLVLSSPALAVRMSAWQRRLLSFVPDWAPHLTVSNGIDPDLLSHDPQAVLAYRADPLCHDRLSPRLARFIVESGRQVLEAAPGWSVPTLLLYAGQDAVVDPAGAQAFAAAAPGEWLETRRFDGLHHELFHERASDRLAVVQRLLAWLVRRCPAH